MVAKHTDETRAKAVARVLAGESVSGVARDMGITRTCIQNWLAAIRTEPVSVMTRQSTRELLDTYLQESLVTLTAHARLYGSDSWLQTQDPKVILESTRALGNRFTAIMDRLVGRPRDDSADS